MDPRRSARVREHVSGVLHAYTLDCELAAPIRKKIFFPTRFAHSEASGPCRSPRLRAVGFYLIDPTPPHSLPSVVRVSFF